MDGAPGSGITFTVLFIRLTFCKDSWGRECVFWKQIWKREFGADGTAASRMVNEFVSILSKDFPSEGISNIVSKTNPITFLLIGRRRKGIVRFIAVNLIIDRLKETRVLKKRNIRGLTMQDLDRTDTNQSRTCHVIEDNTDILKTEKSN